MRNAFWTLSLCCAYAHSPAQQPAGLPMGATDLIPHERFEAYKVQSHVSKTVALSASFFIPTQDVHAQLLENLTFKNVLETASSPHSPGSMVHRENGWSAISNFNTQLTKPHRPINSLLPAIRFNFCAQRAQFRQDIPKL